MRKPSPARPWSEWRGPISANSASRNSSSCATLLIAISRGAARVPIPILPSTIPPRARCGARIVQSAPTSSVGFSPIRSHRNTFIQAVSESRAHASPARSIFPTPPWCCRSRCSIARFLTASISPIRTSPASTCDAVGPGRSTRSKPWCKATCCCDSADTTTSIFIAGRLTATSTAAAVIFSGTIRSRWLRRSSKATRFSMKGSRPAAWSIFASQTSGARSVSTTLASPARASTDSMPSGRPLAERSIGSLSCSVHKRCSM